MTSPTAFSALTFLTTRNGFTTVTEALTRTGTWKIATGAQAAMIVGVSAATIRTWTKRGYIQPVRPGARPCYYSIADIQRCASERLSQADRNRLIQGWQRISSQDAR